MAARVPMKMAFPEGDVAEAGDNDQQGSLNPTKAAPVSSLDGHGRQHFSVHLTAQDEGTDGWGAISLLTGKT